MTGKSYRKRKSEKWKKDFGDHRSLGSIIQINGIENTTLK